jgi:threonine aldolase
VATPLPSGAQPAGDPPAPATDEQLNAARAGCTRFLVGHGFQRPADLLSTIPADVEPDRYGAGGVVADLENEVAQLLGKRAALFLVSGTMAQQATLRVHADHRNRRGVVFHPACHLDWGEGRAYERLHGLIGIPAGELRAPLSLPALEKVAEPPAALLLELPQRDLGGVLPAWDDLLAQVAWARDRGAAVHMDGARLWESTPWYGREPAEIAALFDTVYVSFYKGLGAISGCCLAGPEDLVAEVSEWRIRHGGRLFAMWPYAAAALAALRTRLPLMPRYFEHALSVAEALKDLPGVRVLPNPPQSPMMHLQLEVTVPALEQRALHLADREKIWTMPRPFATEGPDLQRVELSVGDGTLEFEPGEVRDLVDRLVRGSG